MKNTTITNSSVKNINFINNNILLLYCFLILVFSFPRVLQPIKIMLLIFLLIIGIITTKLRLNYIKTVILYSSLFVIPLIIGILYGNNINYVFNSIKLNLLFPLLLLFILQQFRLEKLITVIRNSAFISTIITIIITISTLITGLGLFPYNFNLFFYENENAIGLDEGFIHIINSPLSYLIFITPLYFIKKDIFSLKNFRFYIFFLSFIIAIVSGRRILLLPYIIIITLYFKKTVIPLLAVLIIFFILADKSLFENFDTDVVITRFSDAINSEGDSSVRKEQSVMFEKYINKSPILGMGLGSFMKDYIRNKEFETAYEKSFDYMMFSLGIPLTVLTLLYYFYLMYKVHENNFIVTKNFKNALIFATISILIASTTNPYWLSSFDYCLPLALLMRFSQPE